MCKCKEKEAAEMQSGCGCSPWKKYLLIGLLVAAAVGAFFYARKKGMLPE